MLGMSFVSFLVLLAIGVVVAAVFHFVLRYRVLEFFGKIAAGWLGGWLGSPVLGHWLFKVGDVYVIPAILGATAAIFFSVLGWKALAGLWTPPRGIAERLV